MAAAVRELIDAAGRPAAPNADPFYRHITAKKEGSGRRYDAQRAKRDLYRRTR